MFVVQQRIWEQETNCVALVGIRKAYDSIWKYMACLTTYRSEWWKESVWELGANYTKMNP